MKLHYYLMFPLVLTFGLVTATAAAEARPASDPEFETLQYEDAAGAKLLYRLAKPGETGDPQKPHPLVVFLHGAGERGSDNQAQLKHGREMMLTAAKKYGAFVLVPQCPSDARWVEVDWRLPTHKMPEEPSSPMRLLVKLLAGLQGQYAIEDHRIYVIGLSMGGFGTWDIIERYPEMFAAAVPICGGGDETRARRIARIPVWAFHGAKDTTVSVSRTRNMIQAIKAAGGQPKYTEYPDAGHDSWSATFKDPQVLKWLFSQRRPTAGSGGD